LESERLLLEVVEERGRERAAPLSRSDEADDRASGVKRSLGWIDAKSVDLRE
jgi:hypothetical protein